MTNYNSSVQESTPKTYQHPWYTQQSLLENTTTSESQSKLKPAKESLGRLRTELSTNRRGDIAELYVCLIAEWKGADVFRNAGCDGKTDIVLKIEDQLVEIDVKLAQYHQCRKGVYSWKTPTASNVELPIYPVLVIPYGDIMDWRIRWKQLTTAPNSPPHCPPGLENFWSKPLTHVGQGK